MTNTNSLKLIENKKPVETVYEIKSEIPTFEEFMKDYNENEKVIDNYQGEFEGYEDMRLKGTYYGPGFWDDIKKVVKPVASGVLVAASLFPPTAAIAVPVAVGVGATGALTMGAGHLADSDGLKEFGKDIVEIAINSKDGLDATGDSGLNLAARNNYFRK
jgi:hypothetical protein